MLLKNIKVYNDGGHFIGILKSNGNSAKRHTKHEEPVAIVSLHTVMGESMAKETLQNASVEEVVNALKQNVEIQSNIPVYVRGLTHRQIFNELYKDCRGMSKEQRVQYLTDNLLPYFPTEQATVKFIEENLVRKKRNSIVRRIGINRKVFLNPFNYFVTFTYADDKHTEQSFKRKLKTMLSHNANRKGWSYLGVWERSPSTDRLHFHALMNIPEGTLQGNFEKVKDYSTTNHKMQVTVQNTYFAERFGRNDFRELNFPNARQQAISYITKYLEKSGERISCSKGLCKYIQSDIMEEDILCEYGLEGTKVILADDFTCIVNGKGMGKANDPRVLSQMPKCN